MISNLMKDVLKLLVGKLRGVKWTVLGSANIALHGIDISPNDIDILTDKKGTEQIAKLLKEFEVRPFTYGEKELFRSCLAEYNIRGIKIEVMSDFEIKRDGKWDNVDDRLNRIKFVKLDGFDIPASSLEDQLAGYKRMNREKDKLKIKLMEEFLSRK